VSWKEFGAELEQWRRAGRAPEFWWRDDDAGQRTPLLDRLLALAGASSVPLALAVVPAQADPDLMAGLDAGVSVIQHGTDHVNRARSGEKKTEFPAAELAEEALARLKTARKRLEGLAGARFFPVLAPPWNRLPESLVPRLAPAYAGLSRYGARKASGPLLEVNTHADIIDWQQGRVFAGEEAALRLLVRHLRARRGGEADRGEPTGLLTHHACHDEAAWSFLERLFAFTHDAGARWRSVAELFG